MAEPTPEQKAQLEKRWELADEFEKYIAKWMALESIEHVSQGRVAQIAFITAMSEALSNTLARMVVLAGWSDELALNAFRGSLQDYRKHMQQAGIQT